MKTARMLPGVMMLVLARVAQAGDVVPPDQYDDYTSRMLHAYKKEQASCGVPGRELECLTARYELERAAEHQDPPHVPGCTSSADCNTAPASFWGM
jgi:hypothetical protein